VAACRVLCVSYAAKNVTDYVCVTCYVARDSRNITCDFSKEKCSSLKMILGSKHVAAILNVVM